MRCGFAKCSKGGVFQRGGARLMPSIQLTPAYTRRFRNPLRHILVLSLVVDPSNVEPSYI
jgi:hypothetical protein